MAATHIILTDAVHRGLKWRFPVASVVYRNRDHDESGHVGAVVFIIGDALKFHVTETPEQIDALIGGEVRASPNGCPPVGSTVQLSGANSDGPDGERTYTDGVVVIAYTPDGLFGCFQKLGCWPFVERLANCAFLPALATAQEGR
jgi:hypothetical protein